MRYGFSVARGSFSKGATTREFNAGEGRETKKNAKRSMLDQVRRIAQQYGEFIERDDERKSLYLSKIEREKKGWRNFAILGEKKQSPFKIHVHGNRNDNHELFFSLLQRRCTRDRIIKFPA